MNLVSYSRTLIILLAAYQANSSCPADSKELDATCGRYCYQVVQPLLQYVNTVKSMTQEHNELQHSVKIHAETIASLKKIIEQKSEETKAREEELEKELNHIIKIC
ncbi:hypothetical protein KR093_008163 [Drosophila rubida]|uniref:Uncharacterized protein n=1 Tax=Drosophila rubida TaxID=30044 RepID=A0AAD4K6E1_9MUSC|nr:hypothetical protein KR093_008163 [Drosophila rubida]